LPYRRRVFSSSSSSNLFKKEELAQRWNQSIGDISIKLLLFVFSYIKAFYILGFFNRREESPAGGWAWLSLSLSLWGLIWR
jgi:hypothetical protein